MEEHDATEPEKADARLAVSELFTNAVEYGYGSTVVVSVDALPTWWALEMVCAAAPLSGVARRPDDWSLAPVASTSGRGLGIVKALLRDVEVVDGDDDTMIIRGRIARERTFPADQTPAGTARITRMGDISGA